MSAHEENVDASTIAQFRFDPSPATAHSFGLVVVEGVDAGRTFHVRGHEPPVLLGQSCACALRLTDVEVSRRHLSLEIRQGALHVCDLGSTNGTSVNGVSIEAARLYGGELIAVGATKVHVRLGVEEAPQALPLAVRFGALAGASQEMRRLYPLCERLARSDIPVMIEGETGTGKEVLAEAIHEASGRSSAPFVVFDCTAVAPSVMESELFGHERGAFTGATSQRKGLFEQAQGGTLFIDEIGDLDLVLQPKLLRAVERGEIRRVGGDRSIRLDLRIIAATRRDLDREVQAERFRDDLFHRLAVGRIALPPLRDRKGDVAVLATQFWKALGGDPRALSPGLLARWELEPWPGNVRELRNAVARQLALGDLALLARDPAPETKNVPRPADFIDGIVDTRVPLVRGREMVVVEYERRYVSRVLEDNAGNVVHAARQSGLARRHFQRIKARTSKT